MWKRAVAVVTLVAVLAYIPGCYSAQIVPREQGLADPTFTIEKVVTNDGMVVKFRIEGAYAPYVVDGALKGVTKTGVEAKIPLDEIRTVYVRKIDGVKTGVVVVVLAVVVGLWAAAVSSEPDPPPQPPPSDTPVWSCPLLYSYDGEGYTLDGEPYGGAICEGLARTDLCELEHLIAAEGEYRLYVSNEFDEKQHIDELALLVVDHDSGVRVLPDAGGTLHTVSEPAAPTSATDEHGADQLLWLAGRDALLWVSDPSNMDPARSADLRDSLFLTFPTPEGAASAKLVVGGCNTAASSSMLKHVSELWGDGLEDWHEALAGEEWQGRLHAVYDREELTMLHVRVLVDGKWEKRGTIHGSGPYVAEDRVVPLDLSGVVGDELKVLLTPPANFWTLNSLAVDYSDNADLEVTRVIASSAIDDDGTDVASLLEKADGEYYDAPLYRQAASLTFRAPPVRNGLERTVFAQATGYYSINTNAHGPTCADELTRIEDEPGYVVRVALTEYLTWRDKQFARLDQQ